MGSGAGKRLWRWALVASGVAFASSIVAIAAAPAVAVGRVLFAGAARCPEPPADSTAPCPAGAAVVGPGVRSGAAAFIAGRETGGLT